MLKFCCQINAPLKIENLIWLTTRCYINREFARQLKDALATKGFKANVTSFNGSHVGFIISGKQFTLRHTNLKLWWFGRNMGEYIL